MPVAFVWFLIVLSFPLGAALVVAAGVAMGSMTTAFNVQYVPFWHELPLWLIAVVVGYWQWFVLAPYLLRLIFRAKPHDA